jgi:hypothetical protein
MTERDKEDVIFLYHKAIELIAHLSLRENHILDAIEERLARENLQPCEPEEKRATELMQQICREFRDN